MRTFSKFLFWLCLLCSGSANSQAPLSVFAAASLKESMDEVAVAYEKSTGISVRISYAASSALARQIEHGAPADVFISADLDWMDYLQERDLLQTAQRRNLLGNTLVLVAPVTSSIKVDPAQPGEILRALGSSGRLALGQTNSVPAGKYARSALLALGQWNDVSTRLAEAESVRAALMLVSRGEAPLGIVYGSDARADSKVRVVAIFPDDSHVRIVYPVAPLKSAVSPQAVPFVQWLAGAQAREIFLRRGFTMQE
jgi:molybdate transport system substrate-binding protein